MPVSRRGFLKGAAVAGAAVAMSGLAACGGDDPAQRPGQGGSGGGGARSTKVTFGLANQILNPSICYYWIGLSERLNWYRDEGIEATWTGFNGATVLLTAMQQGSVQVGVGFQDPMFQAIAKGTTQPYKMFFNATYGILYAFGVRPDSDIRDFDQLRGKRLSVQTLGSASHYYAQKVLQSAGVNPQTDVSFVPLYGPAAAVALEQGQIDCIVSFDTDFASNREIYGHDIRLLPQPDFIRRLRVGNSLGGATSFLEANPDVVAAAGRVGAKSEIFTQANPDAALRLHFEMFPETLPSATPVDEAVKQFLPGLQERMKIVLPGDGLKLGEYPADGWKDYLEYQGVTGVDPAQYSTNDFIDRINDFDHDQVERFARDFTL